jgi:hypothetical protein
MPLKLVSGQCPEYPIIIVALNDNNAAMFAISMSLG